MNMTSNRHLLVLVCSLGLMGSGFSCAPLIQPKVNGLTPTDAQEIAIRAVRTAERNSKLEVEPFDTHATPAGDYSVSLQSKTTTTTADHWRVIVHPNRSAEVVHGDPAESTPETLRAHP